MELIKPSWEILEQESGIDGIYKAIERAGRTCYKSEDKITENSAKPFVDRMVKSGHGAMLEHGTVYLKVVGDERMSEKYQNNPYSRVILRYPKGDIPNIHCIPTHYITTNFRVLIEEGWLNDLKFVCEPTGHHEKRITVCFICDRGVSHEFVRHRVFSFAQESTRYCNYSKDKFGNEITFIEPCWLEDYNYESNTYYNGFLVALRAAEANYLNLLKQWEDKIPDKRYKTGFRNNPWTPQQARAVLPNALKTELVMTGFINDWKHFFELRCAPNAHPSARELAIPLSEEFIKRGLV
nr:MAG TPA: Thymidylate synthase complementing protein [Crassvirales sp.]